MSAKILSEKHSANCFLNSLFREWTDFLHDKEASTFIIKLKEGGSLLIPVEYFSLVGRHAYTGKFYFKKSESSNALEIDFLGLTEILLSHLSSLYKTSPDQINIFQERIKDSLENMEVTLDSRLNDLSNLYTKSEMSFKEAEQGLFVGHTFHPHPKNRDEFSHEDFKIYSPEAAGEFNLTWLLVDQKVVHEHISDNFEQKKWAEEIFQTENPETNLVEWKEKGLILYPVHPWQKKILLNMPVIQDYLQKGLVVDLDNEKKPTAKWFPTSSLRSIYSEQSPYMLKFSLSVRLTNSIRHLLPLEVVRGLQVLDVFSTDTGKSFLNKYPTFNILFEPAFMAIKDPNGKILNETIVALRTNPFVKNTSQKIVLATLTQDHPQFGLSLIGSQVKTYSEVKKQNLEEAGKLWFEKYLDVAVKPLMMAQANFGVLLGAHQQNLILEIKDNMPVASFFRDCQGTGYSQKGFELFSKKVDLMTLDNGNVLDEKMGNYLFSYYLMINSTFNVISSIAKDAQIKEEILMGILKGKLKSWMSEGVLDESCFNYLLNEPVLMQKGNFLCSFVNMNENTTENPLGIYNPIPNPIFETQLC